MDKYINTHTYEISWDMENYIPCDEEIAEAIAILNQKGYKTAASCAGHNRMFEKYTLKWPVAEKEEFIKNQHKAYVVGEDKEYIWYIPKILGNATYILFAENYQFDNAPDGFEFEEPDEDALYKGCTIICHNRMYKDEEGKIRKSDDEINNHLKRAQKSLLDWAKSLKNINENKRGK